MEHFLRLDGLTVFAGKPSKAELLYAIKAPWVQMAASSLT